jgi:hypothetical protein
MLVGINELLILLVTFLASLVSLDVARDIWNPRSSELVGSPEGRITSMSFEMQQWQRRVANELAHLESNATAAASRSVEVALKPLAGRLRAFSGEKSRRTYDRLPNFAAPREFRRATGDVEFAQLAATLERAINSEIRTVGQMVENATFVRNTADKLVYQLHNFAPMKHRFASEQWNDLSMEQRQLNGSPNRAFVIAISSVNRATNYLFDTVTNLVSHMSETELRSIKIVLLNAEWPPDRHLDVPLVRERFKTMIEDGSMEILELQGAHKELLPGRELARRWGDDERRIRWRSKQVLDVALLLDIVQRRESSFAYALVMEDDVVSAINFVSCIRRWVDSVLRLNTRWSVASFYNPWDDVADGDELPPFKFFGVIGQLFRIHDLPVVVEFLRKNFDQSPLDWLFVDFLKKFNGSIVVHTPSLFQHQGKVSSFAGKQQNGASANFVESC